MIRPIFKKTLYKRYKGKKPNIGYFHPFCCKCYVLNYDKNNLGNCDAKSDEGIFLGYSLTSKAYKVFNKRTLVVEELIHVVFDEVDLSLRRENLDDDDLGILSRKVEKFDDDKIGTF